MVLPVKGVVLPAEVAVGKLITLRDLAVSVSALLECSTLDIPYLFDDNLPKSYQNSSMKSAQSAQNFTFVITLY
jgi:hypothetical protein